MLENLTNMSNITLNPQFNVTDYVNTGWFYNDLNKTCYLNYINIMNSLERIPKIAWFVLVVAVIAAIFYTWLLPLLSKDEYVKKVTLQAIFQLQMWAAILMLPYVFVISDDTYTLIDTLAKMFTGLVVVWLAWWLWKKYKPILIGEKLS